MKKIIILLLSIFIYLQNNQAQTLNQDILNNIAPQSPEVFNLTRYTYYPISHTTGIVNTEIPIYIIKTKQLELPISLSYHNSGIKVNDMAGSVGLGWTLNAGGTISIQGGNSFGFLKTFKYYDLEKGDLDIQIANELGVTPGNNSRIYDEINSLYQGNNNKSTQAEIFIYNIPGHISGKFIFDTKGKPKQIPLTDNKIEPITNNPSGNGIKITSSAGIQYYFTKYKIESKKSPQIIGFDVTSGVNITTGLYLDKIISADNKDSIIFKYKELSPYYTHGSMQFIAKKNTMSGLGYLSSNKVDYSVLPLSSTLGVTDWILEKILFNGGEILFTTKKDRKDRFPERISNITVYNESGSSIKSMVMSCELLNNEYFVSDGFEQRSKEIALFHRLKLSGINISSSKSGEVSQSYRFFYNPMKLPNYDDNNDINTLPGHRFGNNYAQDIWGYYNGKANPHLSVFNGNGSVDDFYKMWNCGYLNPNREISEEHVKACSLEKIAYPSGGYVVFDLESNRDDQGFLKAGLRIKRQHLYDRNHILLEDRQYEYRSSVELMSNSDIIDGFNYNTKLIIQDGNPTTSISSDVYQSESASPNNTPSSQMYYGQVIEYQGGLMLNEGKTVYNYNYGSDAHYFSLGGGNSYNRFSKILIDRTWSRGFLEEEQSYKKVNNDYKLIRKTRNAYNLYLEETFVTGLLIYKDVTWVHNNGYWKPNEYINQEFHWYNTYSSTGVVKSLGTTTVLYDDSGNEVSIVEELSYDKLSATTNAHQNVTKKTVQSSDGSTDITRYIYPLDYAYNSTNSAAYKVIQQFRDANIVSIPFEQVKSKKTGTSELAYGGEFYDYEGINRLKTISVLQTPNLINYAGATRIETNGYNKSSLYTTKYTMSYDDFNNIKEVVDPSGLSTSYLWSYNSLHPVAEIKNATSDQVVKALQSAGLKYNDLVKTMSPDIQKIRSLVLSNSQISTFTFSPMVGVSSIAGARGTGLYYTYDGFNRLSAVKDDNASVVAAYNYNINPSSSNVFMRADQTYIQYRKGSATVEVDKVSSGTTYQWTLSDTSNKVLFTGSSKDFEFTPPITGSLNLKCIVSGGNLSGPATLTRTINILNPPEMGVSEISTSSDQFRINGRSVDFSIKAIEGSFQYSYAWTMKSKTKTKTGTGTTFSIKFEEEGSAQIICVVKDLKLGKTETRVKTINILPPIPVNFWVSLLNNVVGKKSTIIYNVDGNTGSGREYIWNGWTIKTPSKTITSKEKSYIFDLIEYGTYSFTGSLTDPYNGYTKTVSEERTIMKTLFFSDIKIIEPDASNNYVAKTTAIINATEDLTVTFKLESSRRNSPKNNSIYFYLSGNSKTIGNGTPNPYNSTIQVTLKKGIHNFEIRHPQGYADTGLEVSSITITKLPAGYEEGEAGEGRSIQVRTTGRGNMY